MDRTPSPKRRNKSPTRNRSPSRTNHSPTAIHVSAEAIRATLSDIGVDQSDVKQIDEIFKSRVPSQTRKIKETTFETLVNLNEKWNRHKKKTAEIIKETKKRDIQHRETAINLKKKINSLTTENERHKGQIKRLEININELQSIEKEQSKDREEREGLKDEVRKLKAENDSLRQSKLRYQEKNKTLEHEKRTVELDNKKLRDAYNKQEQLKHQLERDLRETKTELEMFEDMLKKIPQQLDDSLSDFSDFDQPMGPPSPIAKSSRHHPSASHAVSQPISSSTPMVTGSRKQPMSKLVEQKVSMTTNLLNMSGELQQLAAEARAMKEQDEALQSLIFDDSS